MNLSRRSLLSAAVGSAILGALCAEDDGANQPVKKLVDEVGVTTSSLSGHVSASGIGRRIALVDLPRVLVDELDMRVIDLNTSTYTGLDSGQLDRFRENVEKAGCVVTNVKFNQRGLDLGNADAEIRRRSLAEYKKSIDTAARLGARWVRPLPTHTPPVMEHLVAGYRQLMKYAAPHGIQLLVENFGWMDTDINSGPKLIEAIGGDVAACPDTGNWASNDLRYAGLAKLFPLAVTCDFKARRLGPNGEHILYDLKRCFQIGWQAGFRGPWCLEHANPDRKALFQELALLREMLRRWTREARLA